MNLIPALIVTLFVTASFFSANIVAQSKSPHIQGQPVAKPPIHSTAPNRRDRPATPAHGTNRPAHGTNRVVTPARGATVYRRDEVVAPARGVTIQRGSEMATSAQGATVNKGDTAVSPTQGNSTNMDAKVKSTTREATVDNTTMDKGKMAKTPDRGITMDKVKQEFGDAKSEIPSVGEPPITRWEYEDFMVYFEHDRVITSVFHEQVSDQAGK